MSRSVDSSTTPSKISLSFSLKVQPFFVLFTKVLYNLFFSLGV
ncbi:unnamed protein product [Brassica oleracea var. botrytis]